MTPEWLKQLTRQQQIPPIESFFDLIFQHANRAWSKMPRNGLMTLSDLEQEGMLVYFHARARFNPDRGKFITLLWWCLANKFKGIVAHAYRDHNRRQAPPTSDETTGPDMDNLQAGETTNFFRMLDLSYRKLTRLEHLAARLMIEERMNKPTLYARLGVDADLGRRVLASLQMKLSEACSLVA